MLERLSCLSGCATLTTDSEIDRQTGGGRDSSYTQQKQRLQQPVMEMQKFHHLLRLGVSSTAPVFSANTSKDTESKSRMRKRTEFHNMSFL